MGVSTGIRVSNNSGLNLTPNDTHPRFIMGVAAGLLALLLYPIKDKSNHNVHFAFLLILKIDNG